MAARNELATNHHHHHHRAATSSSSSSSWRYIHAIILQIQRRLLPLIEMMDVELLLRLLLRGPQIPDQVGQTSWPGQAACLLLGQLVRVARCPASAAGWVQRTLPRIVMVIAAGAPAVGQRQWQRMRTGQVTVHVQYAAALEHHIRWSARRARCARRSCSRSNACSWWLAVGWDRRRRHRGAIVVVRRQLQTAKTLVPEIS